VSVLLGSGDGGLHPAATLRVGASPRFIAVRDFDGDGRTDLAVANLDSDSVSLLLNTSAREPGRGGATASVRASGYAPRAVVRGPARAPLATE
jgi:hypothetical protein